MITWVSVIFQIMGWAFRFFGASEKQMKEYQEMIERANKEGKLSVQSYDSLKNHENIIKQKLEAKKKEQNGTDKSDT